jgi:hypothetical protein
MSYNGTDRSVITGAASAQGAAGGMAFLDPNMAIGRSQPQVGPGSDDDLLVAVGLPLGVSSIPAGASDSQESPRISARTSDLLLMSNSLRGKRERMGVTDRVAGVEDRGPGRLVKTRG